MSFTNVTYAILASMLPAFIWLSFWLREDSSHPEPRWLIALSFLGGAVAVIIAIFGENYISNLVSDSSLRYTLWAGFEEIIKFIVVIAIALHSKYNDEPIDSMIYIITVAIGFSAIENALFILGPLSQGELIQGMATGSMRFIGATLVHIVSSAIIGFAIGFSFYKTKITKYFSAIIGLIVAIALHVAFNLSLINSDSNDILKTFAWIWLAVIILIILFEEVKAVKPKSQTV